MKKRILVFSAMVFLLLLGGCQKEEPVDKSRLINLYVVNKEETKIYPIEYEASATETNARIEELLLKLSTTPAKLEYKAPLAGTFKLLSYSVEEGQLILNFDSHYKEQSVTTEILTRAAIVRTMTQVKGVNYVTFQVKGEPLTDNTGNLIGTMSGDYFIDNEGSVINSYERVSLHLYFANEKGDKLVQTNQKLMNTNISMERLVVEQLIKGPSEYVKGKAFPTINPDTKILSVTVKDGVCYVNLDEAFSNQPYSVTSEVTLYSITNSLVELSNINKVQFSINGDTNVTYRENISLSAPLERNLDLVATSG